MPSFTEQGRTYGECMEKIRARYGNGIKVLNEKVIRKSGFLGLGSHEEVEITGTYGNITPPPVDFETAKRQILAAADKAAPEAALQTVLKEINNLGGAVRTLSEKVDAGLSLPAASAERIEHASLQKLEEDLLQNDFSPSFIKTILERVRREFPLEELDNYEEVQKRVVPWIGERIAIYQEPEPKKAPRIIVLVGPTGVGKTTTIAKLAALYGELSDGAWKYSVRLVTLDSYRIGGKQQIEKYGEIMEIPVSTVENQESLKKVLALYRQDVDYVLVDTIGESPRNYGELGKMKAVLDACGSRAEPHLCLSASTKASDIEETLRQFESFKYKSVIITKLDETSRVGNVISALSESGKSVSFITDGQTVPSNIAKAQVTRFLINLEGFLIDRDALARRFPETGKPQERQTAGAEILN
jgi:flagellar biosynthesis protein FlhF